MPLEISWPSSDFNQILLLAVWIVFFFNWIFSNCKFTDHVTLWNLGLHRVLTHVKIFLFQIEVINCLKCQNDFQKFPSRTGINHDMPCAICNYHFLCLRFVKLNFNISVNVKCWLSILSILIPKCLRKKDQYKCQYCKSSIKKKWLKFQQFYNCQKV